MAEASSLDRWKLSASQWIAGGLVVAGFLLVNVSWWFLILVGLGMFGPGVLREMGLLNDKDEFQKMAARRAGYHAYLTAGLTATVLVAFFRATNRVVSDASELATLFLVLLWLTWLLSSLLDYWGPKTAVFRLLIAIGCGWLVFTVLSNLGAEWTGWTALLLHPLLTLPFFVLAWLSQKFPRFTGTLLIVCAVGFVHFFGFFQRDNIGLITQGVTCILFVGPLLASGVALLCMDTRSDEEPNSEA